MGKILRLLLLTCSLMSTVFVAGQRDSVKLHKHLVFVEAPGLGGFGSINYQRILYSDQPMEIGFRIGLSTNNLYDFNLNFNPDIILPFSVVASYGVRHKLTVGIGQTLTSIVKIDPKDYDPKRFLQFHSSATLGYSFNSNNRMVYGAMLYPTWIENKYFDLLFGLFVGYKF